jgi:phosphoribosyl 1,2-cyclic phosphate phosphodiesterase
MLVTILGCGTSVGVPMIGMQHKAQFRDPKNQRLRASVLVEPFGRGGPALLIDTSPDLRQQVLRFFPKKPRLDGILLTHTHADHLHGLDDIRPFNFLQQAALPLFAEPYALEEIKVKFRYIFQALQEGGGLPKLSLQPIGEEPFCLEHCSDPLLRKLWVRPIPLIHGKARCLGFRIGSFAYLTDLTLIPETSLRALEGLELLVLDCLRPRPHPTHLNEEQALAYARQIGAKRTVFTHMSYELEFHSFKGRLPRGIVPAYDGLKLKVSTPVNGRQGLGKGALC